MKNKRKRQIAAIQRIEAEVPKDLLDLAIEMVSAGKEPPPLLPLPKVSMSDPNYTAVWDAFLAAERSARQLRLAITAAKTRRNLDA
jgi:hypothetical protein